MPNAYNGQCYATCAEAHQAFIKQFPYLDGMGFLSYVSSSVNASCVLTYSLNHRPWTTNTLSSRTGTATLPACSTPDITPFDPVAAGALFAFFFASVVSLWLVSKNIGLILEAIKKW